MPARRSRPRSILTASVVGAIESVSLLAYAVSIAVFEQTGSTQGIAGAGADLAPAMLTGLFVCFGMLIAWAAWLLAAGHRAARTPFVMAQAFAVVIAQTLLATASTRLLGVAALAAAALAVATLTTRTAREFLQ